MKVSELHDLLARALRHGDPEIRMGDQIESGPYLHTSVGGVFLAGNGRDIILCPNDDEAWRDEERSESAEVLPCLWEPKP